jgi:predicted nucleotide-binding protein
MASRPTARPERQPAALTTDQMRRGIGQLKRRIADLEGFDPQTVQKRWSPAVKALEAAIKEALFDVFGHNTLQYKLYDEATHLDIAPIIAQTDFYEGGLDDQEAQVAKQSVSDGKERSLLLLRRAVRGLEEKIADLGETFDPAAPTEIAPQRDLSKVFVVHGHDDGAREAVARFLERLGIQPIILHEQASQGRTVIEKVEAHGEVGFAVILLTPDDVGCVKGGTPAPRARQNVVLELGYFIGRLGRKHVCALKRGEVEIPSDFAGVVYETFDDGGGWRQKLAAELEAADFQIDWNKVMRP